MLAKENGWASFGDVNAFFGLMLDNIADLVLTVGLLSLVFDFPVEFALGHMVPGTAIGVFVGDVLFFVMALLLAKRTGRKDVTAMPLGLDTPSTFGMVFFVLGPSFLHGKFVLGLTPHEAATYTWHIGICSIVISGVFKFVCAFGANWVRKIVPRAGLLGSLAAIALVLISFLPLLEIVEYPVVGFAALAVILTTLVARIKLPFQVPGALGALVVGGLIYYGMYATGTLGHTPHGADFDAAKALYPTDWLTVFRFEWVGRLGDAAAYLPIVIPFALGTVVGGIDCTESAAAAGDEFDTGQVIGVEAIATLVAGLCGGVIQTTPYIGHPAYKAMGGRAAYTLATAVFVGSAGLVGYFSFLYLIIPKAAVFPILVFIGLEITAQSFQATPKKHYAAVALACVPAMAALVIIFTADLQGQYAVQVAQLQQSLAAIDDAPLEKWRDIAQDQSKTEEQRQPYQDALAAIDGLEKMAGNPAADPPLVGEPRPPLGRRLQTVQTLAGGFIVTSLLWASALAAIIDRRLFLSAAYFCVASFCSLFGVIHSPMADGRLINPAALPPSLPSTASGQTPVYFAIAYALTALLMVAWGYWRRRFPDDDENEAPPPEDDSGALGAGAEK